LEEATSSLGQACYFRLKPPARLGELGGKLLHFSINGHWGERRRGSTPLVFKFHLKLVRKIIKKENIKVEALP